jgi:hypothetical protein
VQANNGRCLRPAPPIVRPGRITVFGDAGDGPCAILMIGARGGDEELQHPADELAAKYGASATEYTNDPREAYRDWPGEFTPVRADWPPSA